MPKNTLSRTYVSDNLNIKLSRVMCLTPKAVPIVIRYRQLSHNVKAVSLSNADTRFLSACEKLFRYDIYTIADVLSKL